MIQPFSPLGELSKGTENLLAFSRTGDFSGVSGPSFQEILKRQEAPGFRAGEASSAGDFRDPHLREASQEISREDRTGRTEGSDRRLNEAENPQDGSTPRETENLRDSSPAGEEKIRDARRNEKEAEKAVSREAAKKTDQDAPIRKGQKAGKSSGAVLSEAPETPDNPGGIKPEKPKAEINPPAAGDSLFPADENLGGDLAAADQDILAAMAAVPGREGLEGKGGGKKTESAGLQRKNTAGDLRGITGETETPLGKNGVVEITLEDRRTVKKAGTSGAKKDFAGGLSEKAESSAAEGGKFLPQTDEAGGNGSFKLIEVLSQDGGKTAEARGALTGDKTSGVQSFHQLLKDDGIPQIVKQSGIILKDNDQGEIRLILKPESLGKVRIRLNLSENHIVGRILVENNSVRDAFNNNLNDLSRAFEETGFASAHLEVAVEGRDGEAPGDKSPWGKAIPGNVIERIEENTVFVGAYDRENMLVNLLA